MDGPDLAPWFLGDLDDPWVVEIGEALPPGTSRRHCVGDLPEAWPAGLESARTLVLHRPLLTNADIDRLRRLRNRGGGPRVVLCVGPHVRYRDLARCGTLAEVILPEATARETVARHLAGAEARPRPGGPRPGVTVISGNEPLRRVLAEACETAGYPASPAVDWSRVSPGGLAVWDVPVLEDDWPGLLERYRPAVALMGFPDREMVALARARGGAACLELPCDPADLVFVLDRLASGRRRPGLDRLGEPGHVVPPAPTRSRRPSRAAPPGPPVADRHPGA